MDLIPILIIYFLILLIILGIGYRISHSTHSERPKNICICIILWATLFFLLPRKAMKSGLIKNKFIAWLVAYNYLELPFRNHDIIDKR